MDLHTMAVIGSGVAVSVTAFFADTIQVDPATIIGGGGVGVLGWLASSVWRYMKGQEELQKASMKLIEAKMQDLRDNARHRESERSHWNLVEQHQALEDEKLTNIHGELRAQRPITGPHTPVTGIPLDDDDGPEPPAGPYHHRAPAPLPGRPKSRG